MKSNSKNSGFTLIELLVVISIISLLSSIVTSSLSSARSKARDSKKIQTMIQIRTAVELYRSSNPEYPASIDDLNLAMSTTFPSSDLYYIGPNDVDTLTCGNTAPITTYLIYTATENPSNLPRLFDGVPIDGYYCLTY